jgi:type IV secretory pathway VirB6-like protein
MSGNKKAKEKKTWFEKVKLVYVILKFLFDLYMLFRKMMGVE